MALSVVIFCLLAPQATAGEKANLRFLSISMSDAAFVFMDDYAHLDFLAVAIEFLGGMWTLQQFERANELMVDMYVASTL